MKNNNNNNNNAKVTISTNKTLGDQSLKGSTKDVKKVIRIASKLSGVSKKDLTSSDRLTTRTAMWRHIIFYCLRGRGVTFAAMGKAMNRTHSTALLGAQRVAKEIDYSDDIKFGVTRLEELI